MVTVINRPLGHKLTDAELTAEVYDSSGEALFLTTFAHGLVDGDYVYVQSDIETYNGYKYVDSIAYNEFKLRESETGDYVQFKQSISTTYRISVLQHGYLAISQPIVYELESDLWPINQPEESYTPRFVSSQADAEGYTQLNLSSALSSPFALDFIEIVGPGVLAGAYQIITVLQPWSVIINLQYSASNNFSGYQVVKYYNNYCINVEIYSGLGVEHPWYLEKPYELAATLRFTPDANGRCKFSISDILKGYLETRNNLTLPTLPNNLDFMTAFYISYYESYDQSDGDEITTFEGTETSDLLEFEGHAINSDMPFKSVYISHMSEYLTYDTYLAKWLILQTRPVLVVGYFFDISFLKSIEGTFFIRHFWYIGNDLILTEDVQYEDLGVGVYRIPVVATSGYDSVCIVARTNDVAEHTETVLTPFNLSEGVNYDLGAPSGYARWTLGAIPEEFIPAGEQVIPIAWPFPIVTGESYTFYYTVEITTPNTDTAARVTFLDTSEVYPGIAVDQGSNTHVGSGTFSGSITMVATADMPDVSFSVSVEIGAYSVRLLAFGTSEEVLFPAVVGAPITEEICMEIIEECDSTFIPDDDIRLTEDGDFRILE